MPDAVYELPEGRVDVIIEAAIEDDFHWKSEDGEWHSGRITLPVLRVTTTGTEPEKLRGLIKLRGKRYSLDRVYVRTPDMERPWREDASKYYQLRTRTEAGNTLDWRSPSGNALTVLEEAVRDRFAAEHPGWELDSKIMRLDEQIHQEQWRADRHHAEAERHEQQKAELQEERRRLLTGAEEEG